MKQFCGRATNSVHVCTADQAKSLECRALQRFLGFNKNLPSTTHLKIKNGSNTESTTYFLVDSGWQSDMSNSYCPLPPGVTRCGDNRYLRGDSVPMPDARPDPLGSFVAPEVLRAVTAAARTFGTGMADTAELAAEPETMVDAGGLHLLITVRGMGLQH
jgi:hypothetical protein